MNYYMIQLSYTADAWRQQIELTRDHAQRLNAVRALIARLGGSLAQYRFFEGPDAAGGGEPHSVSFKPAFPGQCTELRRALRAVPWKSQLQQTGCG